NRQSRFPKQTRFILLGVLLLIATVSVFTIVLPAQKTYAAALKTYAQAKSAWDAIKKQNVELAGTELEKTKKDLLETQKNLQAFSFTKFIPVLGWYYSDVDHLAKAGVYALDASTILIDSIEPYADVLGLKGQGSFVSGSAEDRIRVAVLTMGKVTPRIDEVSEKLNLAKQEVDKVNPNHYPKFLGLGKIQAQVRSLRNNADRGIAFVDEARPLIKVLPSLLGDPREKKYLVLFQNDNELRPTGGFLTAYAIFRIDKGVIHVDKSDDIYNLDNSIGKKAKAPDPISKYLPNVAVFNLRDSNLSPDFIESMKTFNTIYEQSRNKVEVDGIITLDTNVLVSIIKILDDEVYAGGVRFTSKEDSRCDCPQVIYELERLISTPLSIDIRYTDLAAVQAQRKDMLGTLLYALMEKALKSSPKKYWGPLMQDMIAQIDQKHVLFYLYDKDAQAGVEALNAAGRIKAFDGDYLHINEANFGGQKANLFVKESVLQEMNVSGDGVVTKTLTINYKNPHPPSDCNLERGGMCLNAPLRNWVRVYTPKGSKLIDSKGSEVKLTSYDELDKTVFDGFLVVRPLGAATYTLKYTLPFKLKKGSPLPLLIQKQPGTDNNQYEVKVNGKTVEKFELLTDKEFKLDI
ncbi:MAG: DUF4012 domain-containing protein, partial [bacterium]|nr:DUF4012 domain-containing protein [bacterium]